MVCILTPFKISSSMSACFLIISFFDRLLPKSDCTLRLAWGRIPQSQFHILVLPPQTRSYPLIYSSFPPCSSTTHDIRWCFWPRGNQRPDVLANQQLDITAANYLIPICKVHSLYSATVHFIFPFHAWHAIPFHSTAYLIDTHDLLSRFN